LITFLPEHEKIEVFQLNGVLRVIALSITLNEMVGLNSSESDIDFDLKFMLI